MTDVDKLLEGISTLVRGELEDNPDMWVSNTGRFHTNEELAAILNNCISPIKVADACDLHW